MGPSARLPGGNVTEARLARILVVEDDEGVRRSLVLALREEGYSADGVAEAALAAEAFAAGNHDLLLIDIVLPGASGLDLCRQIRQTSHVPIILVTARDDSHDVVAGLEAGADDYVTKPFSPREVVARVRAVLRRAGPGSFEPGAATAGSCAISKQSLRVDPSTRRAYVHEVEVELTRVEFDLLSVMLAEPGRVYTRARLIDTVWGDGFAISDRTVDSHIKSLRRKVGDAGGDPGLIETVRGVGYRVTESEPASSPSP